MCKERLSKLQKWILTECYKCEGRFARARIFTGYYKWYSKYKEPYASFYKRSNHYYDDKYTVDDKEYQKAQVVVTRSLRALLKNGYIDCKDRWGSWISIYDKKLSEKLGMKEANKTTSERIQESFKEYQEPHNITYKEWCEEHKIALPLMPDPKQSYKDYAEAHPDATFEEWYNKKPNKPNLFGQRLSQADKCKREPNQSCRNTKYILLTDKGKEKAKELLNVK